MKSFRPFLLVSACLLALTGGAGIVHPAFDSPAVAQAAGELRLRDGRAQGLVGETARGYIAPVASPTPQVTRLVNRINDARRQRYEEVAREKGIPLSEVEKLAAKKIYERLPSGAKVQGSGGNWTSKR